jgi:hypothetical protein
MAVRGAFEGDGDRFAFPSGAGPWGLAAIPEPGRIRIGLVLPPRSRPLDVSIQPGVVERAVLDAARAADVHPEAATRATVRWLRDRARAAGHPALPDTPGLVAIAGAAPFPLLGAAYRAGAGEVREVPRWATGVLAAVTARDGARAGFGSAATRPVVAALATALVPPSPGGPARFGPLALALAGAAVLEPDQLARLLREAAEGPIEDWPSPQTLAATRRLCARVGARVALGLLTDAARRPDGFAHLALAVAAHHTAPPTRDRLPARLDAFTAEVAARMPLDPRLVTASAVPAGGTAADPAGPEARRTLPAGPEARRTPPAGPAAASGPSRRSPGGGPRRGPSAARVHGHRIGELRLVEPRSADELAAWGTLLDNCLADYRDAWAAGRSRLIGVERDGRLRACLEVTPEGRLRQFLGARNRPVPAAERAAVLDALVSLGVLARPASTAAGRRALAAPL